MFFWKSDGGNIYFAGDGASKQLHYLFSEVQLFL